MSRKKEVRRYLRSTMEVKVLVRNTWLYLVIWVVCAAAIFLATRVWQAAIIMPAIIYTPYLIWFVIRYTRIMAKAESYCFYRAKLDAPHPSPYIRERFYFTVALDEEDGTYVWKVSVDGTDDGRDDVEVSVDIVSGEVVKVD